MIILYLLIALAAIANAVMDIIQHKYSESIFSTWGQKWPWFEWWAGEDSWQNKYDIPVKSDFLRKLLMGPLVWITDLWHFAQMIMFTSFQVAIIYASYHLHMTLNSYSGFVIFCYLVILKVGHGLIFELFYTKILIKKLMSRNIRTNVISIRDLYPSLIDAFFLLVGFWGLYYTTSRAQYYLEDWWLIIAAIGGLTAVGVGWWRLVSRFWYRVTSIQRWVIYILSSALGLFLLAEGSAFMEISDYVFLDVVDRAPITGLVVGIAWGGWVVVSALVQKRITRPLRIR